MKGRFLKTTVVALLVLSVFAGNTWAKKTAVPKKRSKTEQKNYQGTVEITKNEAGDINAVDLKVSHIFKQRRYFTKYHITLDEKGKELGEKMAGMKVNVKGVLSKKAGVEWLTITAYGEIPAKSEKET